MTVQCDIVIVNWNAGRQLADCVASIERFGAGRVASVTIVDNGSTDGSERITSLTLQLRVTAAGTNLGFARACNLGAAAGGAPYVLLLNPDTQLHANTLATAIDFAESQPDVGIVGIRLHGEDGKIQKHVARFPTTGILVAQSLGLSQLFPGRFPGLFVGDDHRASRDVDHVIGAFYLVRRSLWTALGGLDEAFFVYLEDLDFSLRAHRRGWRVHYLAEAAAFHRGGGTSDQVKAHRLSYALQSRIVFAAKHLPTTGLVAVAATTLLIEPWIRLGEQALRGTRSGLRDTVRGYGLIVRALPSLWSRVRAVRPLH